MQAHGGNERGMSQGVARSTTEWGGDEGGKDTGTAEEMKTQGDTDGLEGRGTPADRGRAGVSEHNGGAVTVELSSRGAKVEPMGRQDEVESGALRLQVDPHTSAELESWKPKPNLHSGVISMRDVIAGSCTCSDLALCGSGTTVGSGAV